MIATFIKTNKRLSQKLKLSFPVIFQGGDSYAELNGRIAKDLHGIPAKIVLECGGIDRPLLKRNASYTYIGLDIENHPNCLLVYDKFLHQSVEDQIPIQADLIISTTLLEHVPNTRAAFRAMYGALNHGGKTHHYIPCKWHPYAIILRAVGWKLQRRLITLLRKEASGVSGYRTFFDNCSPAALRRELLAAGYSHIDLKCYYKATEYFDFFVPAFALVGLFEYFCEKASITTFAAGVIVSASKE